MKKLLIVYYSVSNGNTKRIARQLQKETGGDMAELETAVPYTGSYAEIVEQGQREVNAGFMPALKPMQANPADYDVIAVGTPTWWYTMAPAVRSFLKSCRWEGKTVIPFQTHGGWPGHTLTDIKKACPGAVFQQEMAVQFDSTGGDRLITKETELQKWLRDVAALAGE